MTGSKVMFVLSGSLDVGGAERQLAALSRALAKRGFRVRILCLWRRGVLADFLENEGVEVRAIPRWLGYMRGPLAKLSRLLGGFGCVLQQIREFRPDLIHFVLPHAYLVGGFASLFADVPVRVMSRRGMNRYLSGRPFTRWVESMLHRQMTALLANSYRVGLELIEEGASARDVGMIYNGIEMIEFERAPSRREARGRLGLSEHAFVLVKVANLWPYKGHADLIEALAESSLPAGWRLLLVGRDEGAAVDLQRQTHLRGLDRHVHFLGARDDIPAVLAAADVGISASHEEGFPNAVLEYLAAGLATVVTDVGGSREIVGSAGVVVPPHDPSALRAAIMELTDPVRREASSIQARQRAAAFSMLRCVDAHEALYEALLAGRAVPTGLLAVADEKPCEGDRMSGTG